jgi:hypothetical protein
MKVYCNKDCHWVDPAICGWLCPVNTKRRCLEYDKLAFDFISEGNVDSKYYEKYGEPKLPVPYSRTKKRQLKPVKSNVPSKVKKEVAKSKRKVKKKAKDKVATKTGKKDGK